VISRRTILRLVPALIIVIALAMRLHNIGFGLPSMYDPDEPIFMITALRLLGEGTLNPGWFGHPGTTTIYLIALIDLLVAGGGILFGEYANVAEFSRAAYANPALLFIPARVAMALLGTGCVWLTYLIGRNLHSRAVGAIGAALVALNALHIEWSQVIRTDIHAGFFLLASIHYAMRYAGSARARDIVVSGALAGLAIATKWPTAVVYLAIPGAFIAASRAAGGAFKWRHLVLGSAAVPIALILASPYLLLDWPTVLANVGGEIRPGHLSQNGSDLFSNAFNYLHQSLGMVPFVLAAIGAAIGSVRLPLVRLALLPVALAFLLLISTQDIFWSRWVLPVLPLFCLFAALAITEACAVARERLGGTAMVAVAASLAGIVALPSIAAAASKSRERATDTRALAAQWAIDNIPAGSRVAFEHLELSIRDQPWHILFPVGEAGCIDGARASRTGVRFKAVQKARRGITIVNLGTLPSDRIDSCRADFAILTYFDRYRVERARYPDEMATYAAVLAGGRTVALFRPISGTRGGPVVRIVRMAGSRGALRHRTKSD
jgi:hypothetical protein